MGHGGGGSVMKDRVPGHRVGGSRAMLNNF